MSKTWAIMSIAFAQLCGLALSQTASPDMIGNWNVEITLGGNQVQHKLRFEAQGEGKGSLMLLDPAAMHWLGAKPSQAQWTAGEGNAVTFSGPVEFALGNVGRDAGNLVFRGKFDGPDQIKGEVDFSPLVGDGPSKHGTFKATRAQQ
jgi:hypothetical protein